MNNTNNLEADYSAHQTKGRSKFCPRLGTYKVTSAFIGTWMNKPALMVLANWKQPNSNLDYDESFIVEMQVESLKNYCTAEQLNLINESDLVGMELSVYLSYWSAKEQTFQVEWIIISRKKNLAELKKIMMISNETLPDEDFGEIDYDLNY